MYISIEEKLENFIIFCFYQICDYKEAVFSVLWGIIWIREIQYCILSLNVWKERELCYDGYFLKSYPYLSVTVSCVKRSLSRYQVMTAVHPIWSYSLSVTSTLNVSIVQKIYQIFTRLIRWIFSDIKKLKKIKHFNFQD